MKDRITLLINNRYHLVMLFASALNNSRYRFIGKVVKKKTSSIFRIPVLDRNKRIIDYVQYDPNTIFHREMSVKVSPNKKETKK